MNWVAHDIRDQVVDFVRHWSDRAELSARWMLSRIELSPRKYHRWQERFGKANEHNGLVPRDHWLEDWEKRAIVEFARKYPLEGYRRLAFMMLDQDVVAVSPSSVYRVMKEAGLIQNFWQKPSRKGTGFVQPLQPHEHWHIDFSFVNIGGTFYYLCSILDGASRYIVHWEIRESMKEADAEIVLQKAREKHPPGQAPDHQRQRAAVHRQGFQGIHPALAGQPCADQPVLSAIQRQTGALASHVEGTSHPSQDALGSGAGQAGGGSIRGALQHGAFAQRHRLPGAQGQTGRPGRGDLEGAR